MSHNRGHILVYSVGYLVGIKVEAPVDVKGPRGGTPLPVSFPNIPYSFNISPIPFQEACKGLGLFHIFDSDLLQHLVN